MSSASNAIEPRRVAYAQIRRWSDAYLALKTDLDGLRLWEARGHMVGDRPVVEFGWPDARIADVVAIAAVFDDALRDAPTIAGSARVAWRWRDRLDEVARAAVLSEPTDTYDRNEDFWRMLEIVCTHLDTAGARLPAPTTWTALHAGFIADPNARPRNAAGSTWHAYVTDREHYVALRGEDPNAPPSITGFRVPRTTNGDVWTLVIAWNNRLAAAVSKAATSLDAAQKEWSPFLKKTLATVQLAKWDDVYADNGTVWNMTLLLALELDDADPAVIAADAAERSTSILEDAVDTVGSWFSGAPEKIEDAAVAVGHETKVILGDVASGIGDVAGKVTKGFLGEFTVPLLVVGGGLAAVFLLNRNAGHAERPDA